MIRRTAHVRGRRGVAVSFGAALILVGCASERVEPTAATASPTSTASATVPTVSVESSVSEQPTLPATDIDPERCNGTIGAISVTKVRVPDGAQCSLEGTRVDGNVSIGVDGVLRASGVSIDGDVEGERSASVEITGGSFVGGSFQLQEGGSATVSDSNVDGDIEWEGQRGMLVAERTIVGGNLQASSNSGGVIITGNSIDGDLECEQNGPAPSGGGNSVNGDREGQCVGL